MKRMKKGLAILLAVALLMPNLPVQAEGVTSPDTEYTVDTEEVMLENTEEASEAVESTEKVPEIATGETTEESTEENTEITEENTKESTEKTSGTVTEEATESVSKVTMESTESVDTTKEDVPEDMEKTKSGDALEHTPKTMQKEAVTAEKASSQTPDILYQGKSNDVSWSIDTNGYLLVTGTGDVEREVLHLCPWYDYIYNVKTAKVEVTGMTDASRLFYGAGNLKSVDLSAFDTSKVTNMSQMFAQCEKLERLNLFAFDTRNVTDMTMFFAGCSSLVSLDLSSFNVENVTNMDRMFQYCNSLISVDLSSFDAKNITNMYEMFRGCNKLASLDLSGFDMGNVNNATDMFPEEGLLATIETPKKVSTNIALPGIFKDASGNKYRELPLNLEESVHLECMDTKIALNKTVIELKADNTYQLTATVTSASGNTAVKWTSSNLKVATVDENGLVTAIYPGTAEVEAVAQDGSGASAKCTVTVLKPTLAYNTGTKKMIVGKGGDVELEADGSCIIKLEEENPFFPYEVQFTHEDGTVEEKWFETPQSVVEVDGHKFTIEAPFTEDAIVQMQMQIGKDVIYVYPEEKYFTDYGVSTFSLLPLREKSLSVDLRGYTPVELTMVAVKPMNYKGELQDADKIVWKKTYDDDYIISESGAQIDLSQNTYGSEFNRWEMIVGEPDQLASENVRYIVEIQNTVSKNWLIPTAYIKDETGAIVPYDKITKGYYNDYNSSRYFIVEGKVLNQGSVFLGLSVNKELFEKQHYTDIKFFEPDESGSDITDELLTGKLEFRGGAYDGKNITVVTYDADGNVTGKLPVSLNYYGKKYLNYISSGNMVKYTEDGGREYVVDFTTYRENEDGAEQYTMVLYKEYPADVLYRYYADYEKNNTSNNEAVTAAYIGNYDSIAAAKAAGAEEVKDKLFNTDYRNGGYEADYSQGICFTIFVGEDGTEEQEVYKRIVKTETGKNSKNEMELSSGTGVNFNGIAGAADSYVVQAKADSYGEYNFRTILVDESADLTHLAPRFYLDSGAKLYAEGSSTPEVSGESYHDFSKGAVQYTVSSEDGEYSKNVWLKVMKANQQGEGLFISSLLDVDANTKVENGVVYSKREVMLDNLHNNQHDIMLINSGKEPLKQLSAELVSNVVELDEYWTLNGKFDLGGFTTTEERDADGKWVGYGELPNLAKLGICPKDGIKSGTDITGTLTIKSAGKPIMVLNLTGTVGNPTITTKEIPAAVKYVPYGTMIQNSNKYSWNKVSYSVESGKLPKGMELKENGEIYGVPQETGKFTFGVWMENSYSGFGRAYKEFTLEVVENTDTNVENATDKGYELKERVDDINLDQIEDSYLIVSEGIFSEFVDIYLDGQKLTEGEDYEAESGSTRITIRTQTLTNGQSEGTHTLGMEFRETDTNTLKRAAQNYKVVREDENTDEDNKPGNEETDKPDEEIGNNDNSGNAGTGNNTGNSNGNNVGAGNNNAGNGNVADGNNASGSITINGVVYTKDNVNKVLGIKDEAVNGKSVTTITMENGRWVRQKNLEESDVNKVQKKKLAKYFRRMAGQEASTNAAYVQKFINEVLGTKYVFKGSVCGAYDVTASDISEPIALKAAGVKAGDYVVVAHLTADGKWEQVPAFVAEDGMIYAKFDSLSPVFVAVIDESRMKAPKTEGAQDNCLEFAIIFATLTIVTAVVYKKRRYKVTRR